MNTKTKRKNNFEELTDLIEQLVQIKLIENTENQLNIIQNPL